MLKIEFFSEEIMEDYAENIAATVKTRNNNKNRIIFIPVKRTNKSYDISISDLLTLKREKLIQIDGIKLYMYICSAQKYKSMSNVEFLYALNEEYPDKVEKIYHEKGNYEYRIKDINGTTTTYACTRKDDITNHGIIIKAVEIIRDTFAEYDKKYANCYFNNKITASILDFRCILDSMFNELKQTLIRNKNGVPERIVDYSLISSDLRHKLMNSIGIRTCPYCNRNYITRYGINGSKSTADLDHFYQKEQYPLFALSLFNFVPSCPVCNSRLKNTHPADDTMYPYEEGFGDDVHFELNYIGNDKTGTNILHLWQALDSVAYSDFEIRISIDPNTDPDRVKRIKKSKELFHLEELYDDHKQDALETALRTRIYCEGSYKKFCEKLFNKCRGSGMVNSSASDLENYMFRKGFDNEWLMFGTFINDKKRKFDKPLSRMIHDIYHSKNNDNE